MSEVITLELRQFRNYEKRIFSFAHRTILIGKNGAGKSNVLEALYVVAAGKSFRADRETEMIRYGANVATIQAVTDFARLDVVLTDGAQGYGRKKFAVNGVSRRMMDAIGIVRAVLFSPVDMELLTGSPSGRRRYLDFVISQMDREYRRSLAAYEKALRQRNKLLDMIREGVAQRSQLVFWDMALIKHGNYITLKRGDYVDVVNGQNGTYVMVYDKSTISPERLAQYEHQELAAATTLVGPHRDDFYVEYDARRLDAFGSRGQQRMGVLWLKQAELGYLTLDEQYPILLLDDIFSELDHSHREEVVRIATFYPGQVVFTTADEHLLPDFGDAIMIRLDE